MPRRISRAWLFGSVAVCLAFFFGPNVASVRAQSQSTGTVSVTVLDPSGKVVPAAPLVLTDSDTNVTYKAATGSSGTYSFLGLPIGTYDLSIAKAGFQTWVNHKISVQASQVTPVTVSLAVGTASQTVTVSAEATPLLQTQSVTLSTTMNMEQLQNLPINGRDITQLAFLVPGAVTTDYGVQTWNGLPLIDQTNNIDGVISSSSRMKFAGNAYPGPSVRLDSISQMTVTTGQMTANQGYGQATAGEVFVTQRGTNSYHGKVYEDFRNSWLNANSWFNNAVNSVYCGGTDCLPRGKFILNDFGGDFGGPVPLSHHKLFFFGAIGIAKQPGTAFPSASILTPDAQKGNLIMSNEDGNAHVCLLVYDPSFCPNQTDAAGNPSNQSIAQQYGLPMYTTPANYPFSYTPSTYDFNDAVYSQQQIINSASSGFVISKPFDEYNTENVNWLVPQPQTTYFPTIRADYDISSRLKMDVAWNQTKTTTTGASTAQFPGPVFAWQAGDFKSDNYTGALGIDWTVTPTLINQFRGGYFYNAYWYSFGAGTGPTGKTGYVLPVINWAIGSSGEGYNLPVTTYYPVINFSDGLTWEKGGHTFTFGGSFWREQDHYWNPPDGITVQNVGFGAGDPAGNAFSNYFANFSGQDQGDASGLYSTLVGDVSGIFPTGSGYPLNLATGQYDTGQPGHEFPLDEVIKSWNLYVADMWRIRPSLTINYGLRWDFLSPDHDITGTYHTLNTANIYGPTTPTNIFQTGQFGGPVNPTVNATLLPYQNYYVTPQPQIGFAWNPRSTSSGLIGRLLGDGSTVIRSSFSVRRFTEPQQYVWNSASDVAFGYFQSFQDFAVPPAAYNGTVGTFQAGTLYLGHPPTDFNAGGPFPFYYCPSAALGYRAVYQQSDLTYETCGQQQGINFNIKQPYLEEWQLGIQRKLGNNNVISVTYVGHHSVHEWTVQDTNEVNIFQNNGYPSFLSNFQAAQHNLAVNAANGQPGNFANLGFTGDQPVPILQAAFAFDDNGTPNSSFNWTYGPYVRWLQRGQAGTFAGTLAGSSDYMCSLVGSASFSPCARQGFPSDVGYGFPINYWQANPYASGEYSGYTDSAGFGNYNSLQIEFRQNQWHGMQFDANYTFSHALGIEPNSQWEGFANNYYTIRNSRLNYGPAEFDIRHVANVSGTYSLPFGTGQRFINTTNPVISRIVGGWTAGTIITFHTGQPFLIGGGYQTFNDQAPGGVSLNGITPSQIQSLISNYALPGQLFGSGAPPGEFSTGFAPHGVAYTIDTVTGATLTQNTSAGSLQSYPYIYGPHYWNTDIAVTKYTRIRENVGLTFQGEFLNAFNHNNWNLYNTNVGNTPYLSTYNANGPREIELRASIEF